MTKEEIIWVLREWNCWDTSFKDNFHRESYEREIAQKATTGEIVFLKGVRRSGKSTLLLNHIRSLLQKGISKEEILFVNLEDPRFAPHLSLNLLEAIKHAYRYYINKDKKPYIFLDEIQNIDDFEKWLLKEYELKSAYLFATGSNSKLLSKEIGSALSGRYLDVLVLPLGFQEYLLFKGLEIISPYALIAKKLEIEQCFMEYMEFGGFPKVVLTEERAQKQNELKSYFDSILLRDIVARYKLDHYKALEEIAIFLLSNISNLIAINKIKNHIGISFDMANRYFEYLQNSFIIEVVPLFDWSYKKQIANPKKIYAIDTGLAQRVSFGFSKRLGDILENIIYLELKRRYESIYYYKTAQGYEVDFLILEQRRITHLIQVSYDISDTKTKEREIRALKKAKEELSLEEDVKLWLIYKEGRSEVSEDEAVESIPLYSWLLGIGDYLRKEQP